MWRILDQPKRHGLEVPTELLISATSTKITTKDAKTSSMETKLTPAT